MVFNSTHLFLAGFVGLIAGVLLILTLMCVLPDFIYHNIWFMVDAKWEYLLVTKLFLGQQGFSLETIDGRIFARIKLSKWFDFNSDRAEVFLSENVLPRLKKHDIEVLGSGVH